MPAAPVCISSGTLLHSALVHLHRSSGWSNRYKSLKRFYGSDGVSYANWFGAGVETVSKSYFANSLTPIEVLSRHTIFGFYALGLSELRAAEWADELIGGYARGAARFSRTNGSVAAKSGLRWCSACAAGEREQVGFATWKVVHQLPFVHSCPIHSISLCIHCVRCKQPLDDTRAFRLPGEACLNCGSTEFAETESLHVDAYKKLVRRTAIAIEIQDATYRPQNWALLTRRFLAEFDSFSEALCALSERLCSLWGVSCLEAIKPSQVGILNTRVLQDVLHGGLTTSPLLAQLVVVEAIEGICPGILDATAKVAKTPSSQCQTASPAWEDHFKRHAADLGMHQGLVRQVIASHFAIDAAQEVGISRFQARKLVGRVNALICGELGMDSMPNEAPRFSRRVPAEMRREIFRARIMALVEESPENGRREAWVRWPHPIDWLLKNDREWLDRVFPRKRRGGRRA